MNKNRKWWNSLEDQWKMAFCEAFLNKGSKSSGYSPTDEELELITTAKVLRFAGPRASFPNLSFELTNLSGLSDLINLEILVVIFHKIENLSEIKGLINLKCLFLSHNLLTTLKGIEKLENVEEFYFNVNKIATLSPLKKLTGLKTIYCNYNNLEDLSGITAAHEKNLIKFYCLPNDGVSNKEILRVQQECGIICQHG